jgi:hypothetical protein
MALQDLVDKAQYGLSSRPSREKRKGLPILRMVNIQEGRLDLADLKYVNPDPKQATRRCSPPTWCASGATSGWP